MQAVACRVQDQFTEGGDSGFGREVTANSRALLTQNGEVFMSSRFDPGVNRRASARSSRSVSLGGPRGIRTRSDGGHITRGVNSRSAGNLRRWSMWGRGVSILNARASFRRVFRLGSSTSVYETSVQRG